LLEGLVTCCLPRAEDLPPLELVDAAGMAGLGVSALPMGKKKKKKKKVADPEEEDDDDDLPPLVATPGLGVPALVPTGLAGLAVPTWARNLSLSTAEEEAQNLSLSTATAEEEPGYEPEEEAGADPKPKPQNPKPKRPVADPEEEEEEEDDDLPPLVATPGLGVS